MDEGLEALMFGFLAGTAVPHVFGGSVSLCTACFGWRDDPRHWLPPASQAARDRAVAAHEDRKTVTLTAIRTDHERTPGMSEEWPPMHTEADDDPLDQSGLVVDGKPVIPGWEGSSGPFPAEYNVPHVYARDIYSGAGNCVCGRGLGDAKHVQAAPGVAIPDRLRP